MAGLGQDPTAQAGHDRVHVGHGVRPVFLGGSGTTETSETRWTARPRAGAGRDAPPGGGEAGGDV